MKYIRFDVQKDIAILTIDRSSALNALNYDVLSELSNAFQAVDLSTIRAVIITGEGEKSFVAGADIDAMSSMTRNEAEQFSKLGNNIFRMIETFPLPVIAAVNGYALGGGNELALSCDIRICTDNAIFGQPEVSLGITPGFGGTQRLMKIIAPGMAKQLIYSAKNVDAKEAYRIGLVNAVYSAQIDESGKVIRSSKEVMIEAAIKLAEVIARNAPIAVRNCKMAMNRGMSSSIDDGIIVEEKLFRDCFETLDQKEGMSCFLSREKPKPRAIFINK